MAGSSKPRIPAISSLVNASSFWVSSVMLPVTLNDKNPARSFSTGTKLGIREILDQASDSFLTHLLLGMQVIHDAIESVEIFSILQISAPASMDEMFFSEKGRYSEAEKSNSGKSAL